MVTLGETEWSTFKDSVYHFCNLSVKVNLFQIKSCGVFLFFFFCFGFFVCLFVFYEKKREDNEGGNFQIRLYGKLESRKWLPYRHLEMQINFTNIHWKVSWASRKVFGAPRGREQRKRNRSSGHMSSSALGAESASLIPRLGFYIHLGRGGWRLSHLKQNIESGIPS